MPFQKISGNFVELSVDNYLGSIKSGSSISDLGFRTYRESVAGVMPVSGTGGSPGISLALNTVNPLSSDADLRLVKDSTNRQGEGFSVDFSIQNRHQSKVLQISFDMELISGTYTNQDLIPKTGTFTVASTTCTVTASHSLVVGQAVNMSFPGGTAPASGLYVITAIVPGVSFSFTVASGSGSGVSCTWNILSSLRVYIIANPTTNPIVIEPVNTGLQLGIANQKVKHIASFQTNNSGNSYRMVIHVTKPGILPYTVDFANFRVWEPTQSIGAVITDWQSYNNASLAVAGWGNVDTRQLYYCRVGGYLKITGRVQIGTVSGVTMNFPLPSGLTTSNIISSGRYNNGYCIRDVSQNAINKFPIIIQPSQNYFNYGLENNSASNALSPVNGNNIGSSEWVSIETEIPIAGWGSNVAMSSDTGDGRLVSGSYWGHTAVSLTANVTTIKFNTLTRDTHSIYTPSTGITIIPIAGDYVFSFSAFRTDVGLAMNAFVNGTVTNNAVNMTANVMSYPTFLLTNLRAGDSVTFRVDTGSSTSTGLTNATFSFYRISAGSQIIATQETVSASAYIGGANQTTTAGNIVNFNTKWHDTHNAVTTGASWRFTAPMNGKYDFSGYLALSNASQRTELRKNGSAFVFGLTRQPAGSNYGGNFSVTLDLISGDYVDLRSTSSTDYYGGNPASAGEPCYISINRIGI